MKNWTILAGALAMALLASGRAEAANCATVTFSTPPIMTWDPFTTSTATAPLTVTVGALVNANRFRLILRDNQNDTPIRVGSVSGFNGPKYQIRVSGVDYAFKLLEDINNAPQTQSNGATLNMTVAALGNTAAEDFTSGTYTETLTYDLQCYQGGSSRGLDTGTGPLTRVSVDPKLSLTSAGPLAINFGSFTSPSSTIQVGLKSTGSVNVVVGTTNGSKMVTGAGPHGTNASIPYTMTLNNVAIPTTGTTNIARAGIGPTGNGVNWPLTLTLTESLPLSGKLAGGYSDTITLTLTPGT